MRYRTSLDSTPGGSALAIALDVMRQELANATAAALPLGDNPADRRAHPRIPSNKLPVKRVRISNRPTVSLVDLSSGGALLTLPFQVPPESRFQLRLDTAVEQISVPFQLLRCYVAELNGGVTYHAAGVFDSLLNLQALTERASCQVHPLVSTLEQLRHNVRRSAAQSRSDAAFDEMLGAAILWLRRDESLDLVMLKVKAHLTQKYPSLMIMPVLRSSGDSQTSVACFGHTFTSKHPLSAHDRRYLRASAQLISMLEDTRREVVDDVASSPSHEVVRSTADWLALEPRTSSRAGSTVSTTSVPTPPMPTVEASIPAPKRGLVLQNGRLLAFERKR
jgi:PilZ domain-containing protein